LRRPDGAVRAGAALHAGDRRDAAPSGCLPRCRLHHPPSARADAPRRRPGDRSVTPPRRLLPATLLSAGLLALWLVLARTVTLGQIVLGLMVAIAAPLLTARLRPTPVRIRRPLAVARFILAVGRDVLHSNLLVAWGVLTWRWKRPDSRFVTIPL